MPVRGSDARAGRKLKAKLTPMLRYLRRLQERMIQRGFPPVDPLLTDVCRAYDAMHALRVRLHYLTVEHAMGVDQSSPAD